MFGPPRFSDIDRIAQDWMGLEVGGDVAAGKDERHRHRVERLSDWGDPFSAQVDVEDGSVGPVSLQQLQCAIYVADWTDHTVSGSPQLGIDLQCDEVLVFDNQYSGSVVHNLSAGGSRLHRRRDVNPQTGWLILQFHSAG